VELAHSLLLVPRFKARQDLFDYPYLNLAYQEGDGVTSRELVKLERYYLLLVVLCLVFGGEEGSFDWAVDAFNVLSPAFAEEFFVTPTPEAGVFEPLKHA